MLDRQLIILFLNVAKFQRVVFQFHNEKIDEH